MKFKQKILYFFPISFLLLLIPNTLSSCAKDPTKDIEIGKSWLINTKSNKGKFVNFWTDSLPQFRSWSDIVYDTSPLNTFVNATTGTTDEQHKSAFSSWIFCEVSRYVSNACDKNKAYGINCIDGYTLTFTITGGITTNVAFDATKEFTVRQKNSTDLKGQSINVQYDSGWTLKLGSTLSFPLFALKNFPNFN